MKEQFAEILNREMDRKDFLRYSGIALLMLAGGGVIVQALSSLGQASRGGHSNMLASPTRLGYSEGAYGVVW